MIYILFILAVVSRLIPHAANFTLVGAAVIYVSRKYGPLSAAIFAVLAMLLSDIFLGFSSITLFVYAGFIMYAVLSLIGRKRIWGLALAPITGSLAFFLITNFGVWLGTLYPHTIAGLVSCFIAAIPFYRNMIASDVVFTLALFVADFVYNKYIKTKIREGIWDKRSQRTILVKR